MGYDNLKLEKGMYRQAGMSFTQVLESLDPSENYRGTALEGTDAIKSNFFSSFKDERARVFPHGFRVVQDAVDGGDGYIGSLGKILDCRARHDSLISKCFRTIIPFLNVNEMKCDNSSF